MSAAPAATWTVTFQYKRTITGKATGNGVTIDEDNAEAYSGKLTCKPAPQAPAGGTYLCMGTAEGQYSSKGSCVRSGQTNWHTEEARPWKGEVQGSLIFDLLARPQPNWTFTVEAPVMQVHIVDVEFSGARSEDDAEFQVIPDLLAAGSVNADGRTGTWQDAGENLDELVFGECSTGAKVELEKGQARVDIQRQ